jgi:hypothetical protein
VIVLFKTIYRSCSVCGGKKAIKISDKDKTLHLLEVSLMSKSLAIINQLKELESFFRFLGILLAIFNFNSKALVKQAFA